MALVLLTVLLTHSVTAQQNPPPPLALQNATIHTMGPQGTIVGSILVVDGKIKAVGEQVEIPEGAQVVDLKGFVATPGLIDSRGSLWVSEKAIAEKNDKAELDIVDAIDPWNKDWGEVAAQGITSVYVQPGNNSPLGGYGAVLKAGPHTEVDQITLKPRAGVQAAVGITSKSSSDRYAQIEKLKASIKKVKDELEKEKKAEAERKKKAAEEAQKKAQESKTEAKESSAKKSPDSEAKNRGRRQRPQGTRRPGRRPTPPEEKPTEDKEKDNQPQAEDKAKTSSKENVDKKTPEKKPDPLRDMWQLVLEREIPLHVEVHHSDAIQRVLKLADEFNIRVVLDGVSQAQTCSPALIDSGLPTVVGPLWERGTPPAYRKDVSREWLNDLAGDGSLWAIATFSNQPRGSRLLRYHAAKAVSEGLSQQQVLQALTVNPARMLGVADRIGSLEPGKDANISVFAGNPLDPSTATRLVVCDGKIAFENAIPSEASWEIQQPDWPEQLPSSYAVRSQRILIDGELKPGLLIVREGKLSEVNIDNPSKALDIPVFDVKDAVITPGLIVGHSHLKQSQQIGGEPESDSTHIIATDGADPSSNGLKKMRNGGFTDVAFAPLSTSTSSGVVGHVNLTGPQFVKQDSLANKFVLSQAARNDQRFPTSLTGQMQLLEGLFAGQVQPTPLYISSTVRQSLEETKRNNIEAVKAGQRIALIEANSALELRSALELIKNHNLKAAILTDGKNIHEYGDALAASQAGIILQPLNGQEFDADLKRIVETCSHKIPLGFAGEAPEDIRLTASLLASAGMPKAQVLKGLTNDGARIVGMTDCGDFTATDQPASFVIWNDSPLNLSAQPIQIVIGDQTVQPE